MPGRARMPILRLASSILIALVLCKAGYAAVQQLSGDTPGHWIFPELADFESSTRTLPEDHPHLDSSWALGLPQDCLSYEERYSPYRQPHPNLGQINEALPNATHVVLIRVYYGTRWAEDLILSTRALVTEAHKAGYHVWLLHQDSLLPESQLDETPVRYMRHVPVEFRHLLQTFNAHQLHSEFPRAHKYRERSHWHETDFMWREYLGPALFMERYAAYKFAFIVEGDVRYTGRDWGTFFNSAYKIGSEALQQITDTENTEDPDSSTYENQLDFISFFPHMKDPIEPTAENLQDNRTWVYPQVMYYMLQIYGISRKMNNLVVSESKKGNGGYLEQFLPSLALNENLNAVTISLGAWLGEHPLHCCKPQITKMYDEWFLNKSCMASIPLHPVKNDDESIWQMPIT